MIKQFDYILLRFSKVDLKLLNRHVLQDHPTIKNRFVLKEASTCYYQKNFDMYIDKGNNISLRMSIPYLVNGHNHINYENYVLEDVIENLSVLIGLDFNLAKVVEFEYGGFESCIVKTQKYLKQIISVKNYDLQKSTGFMKMFGNKQLSYKIYDAVANAKAKKTYSKGNYPESNLVKHELKFLKPSQVFSKTLYLSDFTDKNFISKLNKLFEFNYTGIIRQNYSTFDALGDSMMHMLFTSLKTIEAKSGLSVFETVSNTIDMSNLSSSQRCKRKKMLLQLELSYNSDKKITN